MRISIDVDEDALRTAMEYAEGRSRDEVVNAALRAFARSHRRRELLALRGTVEWVGDLDDLRGRR
ncbi:MAG: type II toxin-antitoxin system VapB family antitoxin [Myxococcales bacterium]|nr:type II toxin-antitoxin system VapB family antitoxin [Myxococcales bacterium]MCB9540585.1 type II toxin-antitoxin system VapB family antitoxin [Myxococcales bacterium]